MESVTYRAILDEVISKGIEKGIESGRAEQLLDLARARLQGTGD